MSAAAPAKPARQRRPLRSVRPAPMLVVGPVVGKPGEPGHVPARAAYSIEEASALIGVSPELVAAAVKLGALRSLRVRGNGGGQGLRGAESRGRIRITANALAAYLEAEEERESGR